MDHPFGPELLVDDVGSVRVLTLNRPDTLNSFNPALHAAMTGIWRLLAADPDARAVVLTGAGRAFSAGGNLDHLVELQNDVAMRRGEITDARTIVNEVLGFPLPLISAVNGPAVGLGCSVAILADLVYVAESTYLCDPHVAIGLTAADGGAPLWPALVSPLHAKEYLLTGDRIPAAEAVRLGLATRVVPDDEVLPAALAMAERLAALPPQAVQSTKRAVNLHLSRAVAGVLDFALASEFQSFDTPEHKARVEEMRSRPRRPRPEAR
jgi:enoyl-CoA hydratase